MDDLHEIIPNLYLSSVYVACQKETLLSKNIRHIVNVSQCPNFHPDTFNYLTIDIGDEIDQNIAQHFSTVNQFIDDVISKNEGVLVHCYAGISRSVSLVLGYLIEKRNMSLEHAYDLVKSKRNFIQPNPGFWRQLQQFHKDSNPPSFNNPSSFNNLSLLNNIWYWLF
jgi:protein-tyrosine phosphatase